MSMCFDITFSMFASNRDTRCVCVCVRTYTYRMISPQVLSIDNAIFLNNLSVAARRDRNSTGVA